MRGALLLLAAGAVPARAANNKFVRRECPCHADIHGACAGAGMMGLDRCLTGKWKDGLLSDQCAGALLCRSELPAVCNLLGPLSMPCWTRQAFSAECRATSFYQQWFAQEEAATAPAPARVPGHGEQVADAVAAAIYEGVPLWNAGDHAACVRVYKAVAERYADAEDSLRVALAAAEGTADVTQQGWILRMAFDAVLRAAAAEGYHPHAPPPPPPRPAAASAPAAAPPALVALRQDCPCHAELHGTGVCAGKYGSCLHEHRSSLSDDCAGSVLCAGELPESCRQQRSLDCWLRHPFSAQCRASSFFAKWFAAEGTKAAPAPKAAPPAPAPPPSARLHAAPPVAAGLQLARHDCPCHAELHGDGVCAGQHGACLFTKGAAELSPECAGAVVCTKELPEECAKQRSMACWLRHPFTAACTTTSFFQKWFTSPGAALPAPAAAAEAALPAPAAAALPAPAAAGPRGARLVARRKDCPCRSDLHSGGTCAGRNPSCLFAAAPGALSAHCAGALVCKRELPAACRNTCSLDCWLAASFSPACTSTTFFADWFAPAGAAGGDVAGRVDAAPGAATAARLALPLPRPSLRLAENMPVRNDCPCRADNRRDVCAALAGGDKAVCLVEHKDELSPACRGAIECRSELPPECQDQRSWACWRGFAFSAACRQNAFFTAWFAAGGEGPRQQAVRMVSAEDGGAGGAQEAAGTAWARALRLLAALAVAMTAALVCGVCYRRRAARAAAAAAKGAAGSYAVMAKTVDGVPAAAVGGTLANENEACCAEAYPLEAPMSPEASDNRANESRSNSPGSADAAPNQGCGGAGDVVV